MNTTRTKAAGQKPLDAHAQHARRAKKAKAIAALKPTATMPSPRPSSDPAPATQSPFETHAADGVPGLVGRIVGEHRERIKAMKVELMTLNNLMAGLRDALGFRTTLPEKEREAIRRRADAVFKAVVKGKELSDDLREFVAEWAPLVVQSYATAAAWRKKRLLHEKKMEAAAKLLPAYGWVQGVRGLGALGLAIIVGEAGRGLSAFPNPSKLWKMLALAPADEYRRPDSRGRDVAMVPRRRRSALWTVGYSLLMQPNAYQSRYYSERERLRLRGDVKTGESWDRGIDPKTGKQRVHKHCDNLARLIARKAMILDLWVAWREAERNGHIPTETHKRVAAAPLHAAAALVA
jgi:hypothetical protein